MKKSLSVISAISIFTLSACISQEQADAKMAKGCESAVSAMITPQTIKEVKGFKADYEGMLGIKYRRLDVTYVENDDFAAAEKTGTCLFSEEWTAMKGSHLALLEQVTVNGKLVGKRNGVIQGSVDDFVKLTEGADTAMGQ
ncbi:MAG: hypothetical protein DI626_08820 [Micavibrio aeruginosavorus]|uniref:Lipoprotein n=1 Tax=Micavibrio aeruginosavorus TaxID=349221 RepID=A0A2W4ZN44_9BACT|nr:MAG: hypothetical protein DI626_08820 [Micavibrio aeruginosavorus]